MEPNEPESRPTGPSRFEDLSEFRDLSSAPTPAAARRRPALVTTATVVFAVSAILNGIVVFAFSPTGGALWVSAVLGAGQALGAVLVFLLVPLGRPFGIALGFAGVVMGVALATGDAMSGLVTIGVNGFVIYGLAASGPAFRRG
jgi:hypothetical protein